MVKLRGVNVYPTAIGRLLHEFEGTTGEYICRLHASNDQDELTVIVEYVGSDPEFKQALAQSLREQLGVRIGIELVGQNETAALTGLEDRQKPRRLIDDR